MAAEGWFDPELVTADWFPVDVKEWFDSSLVTAASGPSTQTLTPSLFTNSQAFFAQTIAATYSLTPARYDNSNAFYAATVTTGSVTLTPSLFTNTNTFYAATVTPGAVNLSPALYVNSNAFYSPTVATVQYLAPARYDNASAFYGQRVSQSQYLITLAQAKLLFEIYLLHGLATPSPLSVSSTARSAGPIEQSVAEASGVVTINTTAEPTYPDYDPGLMITELAALHGIGQTLTVTSTTRVAGPISQVFGSAGGATTATRQ